MLTLADNSPGNATICQVPPGSPPGGTFFTGLESAASEMVPGHSEADWLSG